MPKLWANVKHLVAKGLEREPILTHNLSDVFNNCATGAMQLWAIAQQDCPLSAIAITEIYPRPRGKMCSVWLVAGIGVEEWLLQAAGQLEEFATINGCIAIEAYGRLGWRKQAKRAGWTCTSALYFKELANGRRRKTSTNDDHDEHDAVGAPG